MKETSPLPAENEGLRQLLLRYNVSHAHRMVYSYDELMSLGVNPDFVLSLLKIFDDLKAFSKAEFNRFKLEIVIDYIRKTHEYYLSKKLLEIEQSIHLLLRSYPVAHPLLVILSDFYASYKTHLSQHIEIEEKHLLPYILHLEKVDDGRASFQAYPAKYSLKEFLVQHHDTEKDLTEVRETIVNYSPPATNETLYRILLSQLQVFEKDLAVHALVEDEVLLPRAMELESKWRD
ncbi:MAG: hemerythrin domain-containing protein [Cytophagales bacterium]|nr:hemerythrin domain-containing protein [Cytophagales bacterium]